MSDERTFVDTNVFVYMFDDAEPAKRDLARACIEHEQAAGELVVSTQVLQELYVALTKGKHPITKPEVAAAAVREIASGFVVVHVDVPLVIAAIDTSQRDKISFWDALIVCAAASSGCARVLSEDLNTHQTIAGVRVASPFS
jgi:predicted nucleic acid-binding protein